MYAFSSIPNLLIILFYILNIGWFGKNSFTADFSLNNQDLISKVVYHSTKIGIVLSIWSAVLKIVCLAKIQKFSIGSAIINYIIPAIGLVLFTTILALIVSVIGVKAL